ncbi:MAG: hypothetical protein ACTSW1_01420 [Candidatus Hodarchaeales archaeon]
MRKNRILILIVAISVSINGLNVAKINENRIKTKPVMSAVIIYDSSEISLKALNMLQFFTNDHIKIITYHVQSPKELISILARSTSSEVILYALHGVVTGIHVNNEILSWERLGKAVESSHATYHGFLSCYSEKITNNNRISNGKIVQTQNGVVDYIVASFRVTNFLTAITQNQQLFKELYQRYKEGRKALLARTVIPIETMWLPETHDIITQIAITRLLATSLFDVPWIEQICLTNNFDYLDVDEEDNDRLNTNDPLELFKTVSNLSDPKNLLAVEKSLWHLSSDFGLNIHIRAVGNLLPDLDPDGDGNIDVVLNMDGMAEDRIISLLDNLPKSPEIIKTLPYDYSVAKDLLRAAHYLQDQQVPFHTALPDKSNIPREKLTANYSFLDGAVETAEIIGTFSPAILAIPLIGQMILFNFCLDSGNDLVELSSLYTHIEYLKKFDDAHKEFEEIVNNITKNTTSGLYSAVEDTVNGISEIEIQELANSLRSDQRKEILLQFSSFGREYAQTAYKIFRNDDPTYKENFVLDSGKELLVHAVIITTVMYYSYFDGLAEIDSDQDGLSDGYEIHVSNTLNDVWDTDNDYYDDGYEMLNAWNPLDNSVPGMPEIRDTPTYTLSKSVTIKLYQHGTTEIDVWLNTKKIMTILTTTGGWVEVSVGSLITQETNIIDIFTYYIDLYGGRRVVASFSLFVFCDYTEPPPPDDVPPPPPPPPPSF